MIQKSNDDKNKKGNEWMIVVVAVLLSIIAFFGVVFLSTAWIIFRE